MASQHSYYPSDDDDDEFASQLAAQLEDFDESMDSTTDIGGGGGGGGGGSREPQRGPRLPLAAMQPVSLTALDSSGAMLINPGEPHRPEPDFSGLPFSNVEDLNQFLAHNEEADLDNVQLLKGAVQMIHHHLVGIPVKDLCFENLLKLFFLDYRYSNGRLEVANCNQVRDLDAVRANLFIYGGHIVNSLEILINRSKHRELARSRSTLRYIDPMLNVWFYELYTRLALYNDILPSMYRAALPHCGSMDALEEQRAMYAEGLQMHMYMEVDTQPQVFLSYYTMLMVVKLKLRLYDGRLYEQVTQPKYRVEMRNGDYVCGHQSSHCPQCRLGLRGHRRQVVKHVFEPKLHKIGREVVNTRSWRPFASNSKKKIMGHAIRVKDGSITDFISAICSSLINKKAAKYVMESPTLVKSVAHYIKTAREPMLPPLEPCTRAWSFYNGILIDTDFYTYEDLPPQYDNLSTVRLYPTWFPEEEITNTLKGAPLPRGATNCRGDVIAVERPVACRFDGFVQNLFCKTCHCSRYTANHDRCGHDDENELEIGGGGGGGGGGSAHPALVETSPYWEIKCNNPGCFKPPSGCQCTNKAFYIHNPKQFTKLETAFYDRAIMPQIKSSIMASPMGRRFLSLSEQQDVYNVLISMLGRPFFKIGQAAILENKEREARGEAPVPTDNLNVCIGMIGKAGTGKSTISKILENTLKTYAMLDNEASKEFWGSQLLDDELEFKPIIAPEITSNFWPRTRFCSAVANEPLVVKRKNIDADVVATPSYQLTLFGNKWELQEVEGSVARRVLLFLFTKRLNPNDVDSQLFSRILMDIGTWLVKVQLAYRWFVEKMGSNGLWSAHGVPQYFHYTKDLIEIRNNVHLSFLREGFGPNGEFLFHPNAYISEGAYLDAAQHYAKRKGTVFPEWVPEMYETQFEDFGLHYAPKGGMVGKDGEHLTDDRYICGIGYAQEFPELLEEAGRLAQDTQKGTTSRVRDATLSNEQEVPAIQNLRDAINEIRDKGLNVPHDLLDQLRAIF